MLKSRSGRGRVRKKAGKRPARKLLTKAGKRPVRKVPTKAGTHPARKLLKGKTKVVRAKKAAVTSVTIRPVAPSGVAPALKVPIPGTGPIASAKPISVKGGTSFDVAIKDLKEQGKQLDRACNIVKGALLQNLFP